MMRVIETPCCTAIPTKDDTGKWTFPSVDDCGCPGCRELSEWMDALESYQAETERGKG